MVSNLWILNDYMLSRTLGSGSGGKVKLDVKSDSIRTRQRCAKMGILRSSLSRAPAVSASTHHNDDKTQGITTKSSKSSSEVRTLREAALSTRLHHPYTCTMHGMIVHQHHYYLVFATCWVTFSVMVGRLKNKLLVNSRRLAVPWINVIRIMSCTEVGLTINLSITALIFLFLSADLKFENILISPTDNIKMDLPTYTTFPSTFNILWLLLPCS